MPDTHDSLPLKPCPFCGSEDICHNEAIYGFGEAHSTKCRGCGVGFTASTTELADQAWNRRATSPEMAEAAAIIHEMDSILCFGDPHPLRRRISDFNIKMQMAKNLRGAVGTIQ